MTTIDTLSVDVTADTSAFTAKMDDADRLAKRFGNTVTASFANAIVSGRSLSDTIAGLGQRLSAMALNAAFQPLSNALSTGINGLFSGFSNLGSGAGEPLNILPFAKGGVISSPSYFPMESGTLGLMGERGAEAIVPLSRGPDGRLGIAQTGGRSSPVTVNITTPDADSFRRSEAEITASIARAVARGQRSL